MMATAIVPLYMGGSYVDPSAAGTNAVNNPSCAEAEGGMDLDNDDSQVGGDEHRPASPSTAPVDVEKAVRVGGHGTKYAAREKRHFNKKQIDSRMWVLRKENYSDKDISKKIEEEFGIVYQPQSIASRLPKIQREKQAEEDERLDDELSDWHVGEDEKLYASYEEVGKRIQAEIAKLEAKKWSEISKSLASKMSERKYTDKACKERFDGLLDGTALIPIELDPDKEGRSILRDARHADARRARAETEAAAIDAVEAVRQEKFQKKARKMEIKLARKAQIEASKAEQEQDRQLKREVANTKALAVSKRRQMQLEEKEKKAEWWKTREMENLVYAYYTGRVLQRKHRSAIKNGVEDEEFLSDDEEEQLDDPYLPEGQQRGGKKTAKKPAIVKIGRPKGGRASRIKKDTVQEVRVSKQTLLNPRSIMTLEELELLLVRRNLPRRSAEETHPQLVARLAAADKVLEIKEIDALLKLHFVSLKGNHFKKEARLQQADAKKSKAGQEGITATDLEFKKSYEGYSGKAARFLEEDL